MSVRSIASTVKAPGSVAVCAALLPVATAAHADLPPAPHDVWRSWNLDPFIVLGLGLTGWLYGRGVGQLWMRAGSGRGVQRWRAWCFYGGLAVLALALVSPVDPLGEALFSFHMAQHLLLTIVAAPLLVLGGNLPWIWSLPHPWRRSVALSGHRTGRHPVVGALVHPAGAAALYAAALWAWHVPRLYEAALTSPAVHALEHASFLGSGILLWWAVLRLRHRVDHGLGPAILALFATALHGGALGALLTFSRSPWYPAYGDSVAAWGLTPLEDQQLAGTLMWVPPGVVYLGGALALLALWLGAMDRASNPVGGDKQKGLALR